MPRGPQAEQNERHEQNAIQVSTLPYSKSQLWLPLSLLFGSLSSSLQEFGNQNVTESDSNAVILCFSYRGSCQKLYHIKPKYQSSGSFSNIKI